METLGKIANYLVYGYACVMTAAVGIRHPTLFLIIAAAAAIDGLVHLRNAGEQMKRCLSCLLMFALMFATLGGELLGWWHIPDPFERFGW